MNKRSYSPPPMPKWVRELDLKYEGKPRASKPLKKLASSAPEPLEKLVSSKARKKKSSQNAKFVYEVRQCSCAGCNEKCFRCDGTGVYRAKVVVDLEKLSKKIDQKKYFWKSGALEVQFSNDMRGGDYGIREQGRFSSLPLREDS